MVDELRDDELSGLLGRSVDALREEVPVRATWRADLLARIDGDRAVHAGWRVSPWMAIAAGIALLVVGGAIGRYSRAGQPVTPLVASARTAATSANVRFVYVAPGAARVSVVGDFNQWNPSAMPLRRLSDGTWIADVPLTPGRYAYAFMVDGKIEVDPVAPRAESDFGENSVLMVRGLSE
jgi:hypothetical protein